MNRVIKLTVVFAILAFVLMGAAYAEPVKDTSEAFSIKVAKGWTSQETEDLMSLVGPSGIPHINMSGEAVEGVTLAQFTKVFPALMKKELAKFKLISSGKTKVDSIPAAVWVYSAKIDGIILQFKNYVIFKDGKFYNVVFCTTTGRFKTDVTGFDAMVKSWQWIQD
ncbi:MAG: hypothetical protein NT018_02455 [Armatimonadetes bacterium]|nr:hypothetical protein [Armatimonadota bacterium]